ncbi:MAG: CDGSH iron-sulfur domain-containing protein [Thermoleophilia bacterium]|nr:CDGSH iron-sulfur domain-containing protein [Thermoleophilia bacterium]
MADRAHIAMKANGPAVVSGEFTITGADGEILTDLNPIVAICRCGQSANKPFCDGTHSQVGWQSND